MQCIQPKAVELGKMQTSSDIPRKIRVQLSIAPRADDGHPSRAFGIFGFAPHIARTRADCIWLEPGDVQGVRSSASVTRVYGIPASSLRSATS